MKKQLYPGIEEAERERDRNSYGGKKRNTNDKPDFIGGKPNYDKFKGWSPEKVLVWLNID